MSLSSTTSTSIGGGVSAAPTMVSLPPVNEIASTSLATSGVSSLSGTSLGLGVGVGVGLASFSSSNTPFSSTTLSQPQTTPQANQLASQLILNNNNTASANNYRNHVNNYTTNTQQQHASSSTSSSSNQNRGGMNSQITLAYSNNASSNVTHGYATSNQTHDSSFAPSSSPLSASSITQPNYLVNTSLGNSSTTTLTTTITSPAALLGNFQALTDYSNANSTATSIPSVCNACPFKWRGHMYSRPLSAFSLKFVYQLKRVLEIFCENALRILEKMFRGFFRYFF